MEEYNLSPYHNQTDPFANILVTPVMIEYLQATKPWVRFMSVISFIMAGFMVVFGVIIMLMPNAGMGGFSVLLGFIYVLLAGLYVGPAYFLHQFASSIGNLMDGGGDVALEAVLASQKSFWRFVGIMTLVLISLYALFFVIAISFGVLSSAGKFR